MSAGMYSDVQSAMRNKNPGKLLSGQERVVKAKRTLRTRRQIYVDKYDSSRPEETRQRKRKT